MCGFVYPKNMNRLGTTVTLGTRGNVMILLGVGYSPCGDLNVTSCLLSRVSCPFTTPWLSGTLSPPYRLYPTTSWRRRRTPSNSSAWSKPKSRWCVNMSVFPEGRGRNVTDSSVGLLRQFWRRRRSWLPDVNEIIDTTFTIINLLI